MKILVPYASTPEARAAIALARRQARELPAELILASHTRIAGDGDSVGAEVGRLRQRLEALTAEMRDEGIDARAAWSTGVRSPSSALIAVIDREAVDLVVVGMRRRSPVGKLVLGSLVQDLLLDAPCDVLTVKAPASEPGGVGAAG